MTDELTAAVAKIADALDRQAHISEMSYRMSVEIHARAQAEHESGERVKAMALAEAERRAAAAARAEEREVERMETARRFMELVEQGNVRAEDEAELRRLLAGAKAPDTIPEHMTVPPDDPTHD